MTIKLLVGMLYVSIVTLTVNLSGCSTPINYESDIKPIIDKKCVNCHINEYSKGTRKIGLRLNTYENVMKGSDEGPIIKKFRSDKSKLYKRVAGKIGWCDEMPKVECARMPPTPRHRLNKTEILLIKKWIDQGANK